MIICASLNGLLHQSTQAKYQTLVPFLISCCVFICFQVPFVNNSALIISILHLALHILKLFCICFCYDWSFYCWSVHHGILSFPRHLSKYSLPVSLPHVLFQGLFLLTQAHFSIELSSVCPGQGLYFCCEVKIHSKNYFLEKGWQTLNSSALIILLHMPGVAIYVTLTSLHSF